MSDFLESAKRLVCLGKELKWTVGNAGTITSGPSKGLRFDAGPDTPRFVSGGYERPVQEAIAGAVSAGDVCYDIGANLGFFSVLLGRFAGPAGSIYAFEPVPKNAEMIERNVRLNGLDNVKIFRTALSRVDGKGELLLARHVGGAVLKGVGVPPDFVGSLTVEIAALDTLVERERIKPPTFVKIDVEGAEIDVLHGMKKILQHWAPTVLLELDDENAAACEKKVSLCQSFLADLGYKTDFLPNSYPDGRWFVRHFLASKRFGTDQV